MFQSLFSYERDDTVAVLRSITMDLYGDFFLQECFDIGQRESSCCTLSDGKPNKTKKLTHTCW